MAVETDRGILLSPCDPDVEAWLEVATRAARKFRHALRELAKSMTRELRWVPRLVVGSAHTDQLRGHGGRA